MKSEARRAKSKAWRQAMAEGEDFSGKSTVEEIRQRFDADVERFSNLQTGQSVIPDAALMLELAAEVAEACAAGATALLDLGCGAGNWTLKLLERLPLVEEITLVDLSANMLARAQERIAAWKPLRSGGAAGRRVESLQADLREARLGEARFDVVAAAAVLHHLRGEEEWSAAFARIYAALRPGGLLVVSDQLAPEIAGVGDVMRRRYAGHLEGLGGAELREKVFAYVAKEDTPRPLTWQIDQLRKAGFRQADVVHKNGPFGLFAAIK